MTSNYFTLAAIVRELASILEGATFQEAYSMRPNELRIRFDRGTLVSILRPIDGAIFFSEREERRPNQNIQLFFEPLAGQVVTSVSIAPFDRRITLSFGENLLDLEFFGTPNVRFVQASGSVFYYKKHQEAERAYPSNSSVRDLLGKQYLREVEKREIAAEAIVQLITESNSAFVHRTQDKIVLALIPLISLGAGADSRVTVERFDSISEAVRHVIIERGRLARVRSLRTRLLHSLDTEIERVRHSLSEMRKGVENSARAEKYAAIGNALLMAAGGIERGAEDTILEIEDRPLSIKLDRTLSPYENASAYFERSKRARAAKEELKVRVETTRATIERLTSMRARVDSAADLKELERIERESGAQSENILAPQSSRFREFIVAGGMTVLVGKNAKQNDELTTKIAKKDDIWLHARGVPGSHVVLQCGKRTNVPKESIERAAEIAAYFSDARPQSLAPVSYTRKKYVRKPKGADPGAVVMEREEVIMVHPKL